MNKLFAATCLLVMVVATQAGAEWMKNFSCKIKNVFGVHVDAVKMIAEGNTNNDELWSISEQSNNYRRYDANNDGRVTRVEFVNRMISEFCYPQAEGSELFDLFDSNRDNVLSFIDANANFDVSGNIPISAAINALRVMDKMAQGAVHRRKMTAELIKAKYDGIGSFFDF